LITATACQSININESPTSAVAELTREPVTAEIPTDTVAPIQPIATASNPPEEVQPTITSPVSTPTTISATPTPTPPPEPTLYTIQAGDSLVGIADQFNVSLDALAFANGYANLDEVFLVAGEELQIPLCQAHRIEPGNTLAGIAQLCDLTLDELVMTNINDLAPFGSLEAVPVGFVLVIPPSSSTPGDLDCTLQPEREQVIEYIPQPGEGIFCLSQKFGVSTTTIMQGNVERLSGDNVYGEQALLLPPISGALYQVTSEDTASGISLNDLAQWYEVAAESVTDWNGNRISDPLLEGQQLFIAGADLIFGPFQLIPEADEEPGSEDETQGEDG
jgi:LysM repeat protein